MKCLRCGADPKFPERRNRVCPKCQGKFAFEPREGDLLTDLAFQAAIARVSADGRVHWGVEHLYYEVCRRQNRRSSASAVGFGFFAGAAVVLAVLLVVFGQGFWALLPGLAAVVAALCALSLHRGAPGRTRHVPVSREKFNQMWRRWLAVHGQPRALIVRPEPPPEPSRPREPDIGDYSFDRAVICDRARTVDLLLANNFHFENNCAVLAVDGYPPGPFETVRTMLKRNPRLQVFALHDASFAGCLLARRLVTDPAWFQGQVPVVDVGLRPAHAAPFDGLLMESSVLEPELQALAAEALTADERAWLAQHTLELAAIRPEQVIKRLFRAMNREPDDAAELDAIIFDYEAFSSDAADSDGGGDSFG
jgi:hypothetical protein